MSCRVLLGSSKPEITPLFAARTPAAVEHFTPAGQSSGAKPEVDDAELKRLLDRVAHLEVQLATETKRAHEAGFAAGETAGFERGRSEIKPVLERLTRSIADLSGLRSRVRHQAEADLVTLSIAIARRVLRRELTVDPEAVQGLVNAALGKVQSREVRKIRVHPEYASMVRRQIELNGLAGVEISCDGALTQGDVIVETRNGDLDGSIETQLAEIERGFADKLRR